MMEWIIYAVGVFSALSLVFAALAFVRLNKIGSPDRIDLEPVTQSVRSEADRTRQAAEDQARGMRQELGDNLRGFQETTLKAFQGLGETLSQQVKEFGGRLDTGIEAINARINAIGVKLDQDIIRMGDEAGRNREALRSLIETKLDDTAQKQAAAAKDFREEISGSFQRLGSNVAETLRQLSNQQKERLDQVEAAFRVMTEKQEKAQDALRATVESRLDAIRNENATKLEEMRKTVDEKLQSTLETRLGESFNRVVEHLERVHKGIGEMQSLAAGVGDLKKVLSNVRVRGTFGEIQLERLLEQFLSPEQYIKNAQIKDNSQERVEFAIKLPGRDNTGDVLLPIDAKFPQEDYERLLAAAEIGDADAVAEASRALETRVKGFAKTIKDKYIHSPKTTDFAILFLPTESLFAEVLRRPGLFELLQREHHITLTGPTTLMALLNALQMGFRSLAIEKRSSEVWQILGAIKTEFGKYNTVVDKLASQLQTAANSVGALGTRTKMMNRKLKDVESLPEGSSQILLDTTFIDDDDMEETNPDQGK